ncbi:MAG: hypothetical protein GY696_23885, partial [Gammaproteobacteria bacterium]|nr:hypothetical protein [Gammaproteobacteria bacterium]
MVDLVGSQQAPVLWDTGSNSHLVLDEYCKENKLKCIEKFDTAASASGSFVSNYTCELPLQASNGDVFYVTAMVVPRITGIVSGMSPAAAREEFGIEEKDLDSIYERRLDIIIGISNPVIFPWELKRTKNSYLWRSLFGRGFIASGSSSPVNEKQKYTFATIKSVIKAAEQFFAVENLGISAPTSLNSILVPGPSRLANQLEILLDFRAKRIGMCLEFSKFYQSVNVSPEDAHLRRVVWSTIPGGA